MSPELGILIALIAGWLLAVFVYLVPSLVAALRSHPRRWSIFMLNLFLGWTVVGWVVALVGSLRTHPQTPSMSKLVRSVGQSNERLSDELVGPQPWATRAPPLRRHLKSGDHRVGHLVGADQAGVLGTSAGHDVSGAEALVQDGVHGHFEPIRGLRFA